MKRTKARAVASILCREGRGHTIFLDKLKGGERSLKVWGWQEQDYRLAKALLTEWGCDVKLVERSKFSTRGGQHYTMRRLHVTE